MQSTQEPGQVAPKLPDVNDYPPYSFRGADMPPPPPLNFNPTPITTKAANKVSVSIAKEKAQLHKEESTIGVGDVVPDPSSSAALPKRCGCPPGSKNKPKTQVKPS
jgi:hypothetical protein